MSECLRYRKENEKAEDSDVNGRKQCPNVIIFILDRAKGFSWKGLGGGATNTCLSRNTMKCKSSHNENASAKLLAGLKWKFHIWRLLLWCILCA
jgi:hypothetical protein